MQLACPLPSMYVLKGYSWGTCLYVLDSLTPLADEMETRGTNAVSRIEVQNINQGNLAFETRVFLMTIDDKGNIVETPADDVNVGGRVPLRPGVLPVGIAKGNVDARVLFILQNLPGRLASALLRLSEKHKPAQPGRTIAITQQEISEMVGMTRESINKQLRAWASSADMSGGPPGCMTLPLRRSSARSRPGCGLVTAGQTRRA